VFGIIGREEPDITVVEIEELDNEEEEEEEGAIC
jgi:hypothetical protein